MNRDVNTDKLKALIKAKEKELKVNAVEIMKDARNNVHILAKRDIDNSFIVWTTYNTGEPETSYQGFSNGKYDMTLPSAVNELLRRANK